MEMLVMSAVDTRYRHAESVQVDRVQDEQDFRAEEELQCLSVSTIPIHV
jgi:hypothetical protein